MIKGYSGTIVKDNNSSWRTEVMNLPLIATVIVEDNEDTIYDCLFSLTKVSNATLVVLDRSKDESAKEIDKFIRREKPNNFYVFDLTSQDPWHDLKDEDAIPSLNKSKSQFKGLQLARNIISNGLWMSVDPKVRLSLNTRQLVYETASLWINPQIDYFFITSERLHSFMPVIWLKSLLFPGPESVKENPLLYMKQGNQILMLHPSSPSIFNKGNYL